MRIMRAVADASDAPGLFDAMCTSAHRMTEEAA